MWRLWPGWVSACLWMWVMNGREMSPAEWPPQCIMGDSRQAWAVQA